MWPVVKARGQLDSLFHIVHYQRHFDLAAGNSVTSSTTINPEQLVQETLYLTQEGFYDSIRQASRTTGAPQSTVYHRRAGRPPLSQTTVCSARLTVRQSYLCKMDHTHPATIPAYELYPVDQDS